MSKQTIGYSANQEQLAPLDQIRQLEAEVSRLSLLARQDAEAQKQQARLDAEALKARAREDGLRAGQTERAGKINAAQGEADQIVAQARIAAGRLTAQAGALVEPAANWAERVVLGLETGGQKP